MNGPNFPRQVESIPTYHMFGFFKSKPNPLEELLREQERALERTLQVIQEGLAACQGIISHCESTGHTRALRASARVLHHQVLATPRTSAGLLALGENIEKTRRNKREDVAVGLILASHLVASGIHLDCLDGEYWNKGSWEICALQKLLEDYMQRHGSEPWGVAYQDNYTFESCRRQYIEEQEKRAAAEEAAIEAETNRAKSRH